MTNPPPNSNTGAAIFPGVATTARPVATPAAFVGPVGPTAASRAAAAATPTTPPYQQPSPTQSITPANAPASAVPRPAGVPGNWTPRPYGVIPSGEWVWQWFAPAATPTAAVPSSTTASASASASVNPWSAAETAQPPARQAAATSGNGLIYAALAALAVFAITRKPRKGRA